MSKLKYGVEFRHLRHNIFKSDGRRTECFDIRFSLPTQNNIKLALLTNTNEVFIVQTSLKIPIYITKKDKNKKYYKINSLSKQTNNKTKHNKTA